MPKCLNALIVGSAAQRVLGMAPAKSAAAGQESKSEGSPGSAVIGWVTALLSRRLPEQTPGSRAVAS